MLQLLKRLGSIQLIQINKKKKLLAFSNLPRSPGSNQPPADPCPLPVWATTLRMLMADQGNLVERSWDENNTSTSRLKQKVCVERVVCLEASHRKLNINCKFKSIYNDQCNVWTIITSMISF
jgi:hypothetical protein